MQTHQAHPPQPLDAEALDQQQQQQKAAAEHQRTYQACIPCRRRKVRCDLGSVDNPHDPPCVRCRREAKECFFSATRRKKKSEIPGTDSDAGDDYYEIKSGRKRLRASPGLEGSYDEIVPEEPPRTPGGSIGRTQPLRRPSAPRQVQYGEEDHKASEQTVGLLQAAEVHGGHDALKLLYEAATAHGRKGSKESSVRPSINGVSPASAATAPSPLMDKIGNSSYTVGPMAIYQNDPVWRGRLDSSNAPPAPTSAPLPNAESRPVESAAYTSAVKAWSRFRFVRAGWFTAREAIDYVQYFYKYLSPLTPVALPDFTPFEMHEKLVTHEPMLTVTILLIASRHMKLEGPGSVSRPYSIHQKLWTYLSGMIDRVVWGQEQFGGGFCGAGAEPGCDVNPLTRKGLRTLGTVESMVLLTEWHPRAMHFPPDEADEELVVPDEPLPTPEVNESADATSKGIGGQRMDAWLEPCWRSDRMCWMLLGMAMSLAFEIGVFDASEWQRHARAMDGQPLSAEDLHTYDQRRGNVRDLLIVYVTQTSGRLGLTSMLPSNYTKPEDSALFKREIGQHANVRETVLHFWLRMSAIMREGNHEIYANKSYTRDLIKNGDYRRALEKLARPMQDWRRDFDGCHVIPKYMRCVLEIEYEYCRVYINALALQAVAERCANDHPIPTPTTAILDPPGDLTHTASAVSTNGVRSDMVFAPHTLAKWLGGDREYMREVGSAARNLLAIVVDGLAPGEYLRHAPVRTYFRIISVSIMLLKSFSLGASESDVADSLTLMDRTVDALRHCIVDDVHVASRFADLLDTLTQTLKPRLIRITADGGRAANNGQGSSREQSAAPRMSSHHQQHHHQASSGTPKGWKQQQGPTSSSSLRANTSSPALPNHLPQQQQQHQQQWSYATHPSQQHHQSLNFHNGTNNPLRGISSESYDLLDNNYNYTIMPPPNHPSAANNTSTTTPGGTSVNNFHPYPYTGDDSSGMGGSGNGNATADGTEGMMQDWLALPLDPLMNLGTEVTQTMYGPELGGQDMLELLLQGDNF